MRAARLHEYGPPEVLVVEEVPEPEPGPRDVLVDVHASSVNPVDYKIRAGTQRGVIRLKLPWILGMDVAGVVAGVGSKVSGFRVGDRVYSSPTHRRPGCYAEQVVVAEDELALIPDGLDFQAAASLPLVALTAWAALIDFAKLSEGEKVLIQAGAGGVGTAAIQIAKQRGAYVAATCSTRNVALLEQLGVDRVVDYTKENYDEVLSDYDVVLDALGGEHQERALKILRKGGRLPSIVAGVPAATEKHGPNCGVLVALGQMVGFTIGSRLKSSVSARNIMRASSGDKLRQISALVEAGSLSPVIDTVYPLDEIVAAHHHIETGRTRGKIVVAVR